MCSGSQAGLSLNDSMSELVIVSVRDSALKADRVYSYLNVPGSTSLLAWKQHANETSQGWLWLAFRFGLRLFDRLKKNNNLTNWFSSKVSLLLEVYSIGGNFSSRTIWKKKNILFNFM